MSRVHPRWADEMAAAYDPFQVIADLFTCPHCKLYFTLLRLKACQLQMHIPTDLCVLIFEFAFEFLLTLSVCKHTIQPFLLPEHCERPPAIHQVNLRILPFVQNHPQNTFKFHRHYIFDIFSRRISTQFGLLNFPTSGIWIDDLLFTLTSKRLRRKSDFIQFLLQDPTCQITYEIPLLHMLSDDALQIADVATIITTFPSLSELEFASKSGNFQLDRHTYIFKHLVYLMSQLAKKTRDSLYGLPFFSQEISTHIYRCAETPRYDAHYMTILTFSEKCCKKFSH